MSGAPTIRYLLGGNDIALVARIAGCERALAVHLDRLGQPTDRYREVEAHELRRIGTHLAEIKAAIAALPELRFPWDAGVSQGTFDAQPAPHNGLRAGAAAPRTSAGRGRLFAHNAIPPGDE